MTHKKLQSFQWQGRQDSEDGRMGLRWHQVVNSEEHPNSCHLVGFSCDLGVAANKGRVGAGEGPNAIRAALANSAWHANASLKDSGNITAQNDLLQAQHAYADCVTNAFTQNNLVIGLGGGHEIAWGSYLGFEQMLGREANNRIGIINFDAHFDLRKPAPYSSSGTPFRQIAEHCKQRGQAFHYACLGIAKTANTPALFDYAQRTNTRYLLDEHCHLEAAKSVLTPMLRDIDQLYITVCLDAFPGYLAPGVSAPSALGISISFVIDTIRWLAQSQDELKFKWRLADIAEMNPTYDIDGRTAKLAARLIFEMLEAKFN